MFLTPTIILEIRGCFRERESRDGGVALSERGETSEDGSSPGSKVKDPSGSKDLGVQGSDLCSINHQERQKNAPWRAANRGNRGRNADREENE